MNSHIDKYEFTKAKSIENSFDKIEQIGIWPPYFSSNSHTFGDAF